MPHFTLPCSLNEGPVLNALVGVSAARRAALTQAQQPIPDLVRVRALVDTGASCTCIDRQALAPLGLTPTGRILVNTPSTGATPHEADQFDVALLIPPAIQGQAPLMLATIPVLASELAAQGIQTLIGRDILSQCLLHYDGSSGFFTLAY